MVNPRDIAEEREEEEDSTSAALEALYVDIAFEIAVPLLAGR